MRGPGQAGRGPADRSRRGRAGPGLDRLAVQGRRATTPPQIKMHRAAAATTARSGSSSTSRKAAGSRSARWSIDGNTALQRQGGRQAACPPGRRASGGSRRASTSEDKVEEDVREQLPALVRRPRLRRLPGRSTTRWSSDSRRRQGDPAGSRSTRAGRTRVGTFDIDGNRRFSTEELMPFYPVRPGGSPGQRRRATRRCRSAGREWDAATEKVRNLYANNGYIYVAASSRRRSAAPAPDGKPYVDLRLEHPRGLARDDQQDRASSATTSPTSG